ncbi:hypothetical protein R2Q93_13125 [Clostridium perfringens]|nr:hypothetical protein [Clostridium perfringens]
MKKKVEAFIGSAQELFNSEKYDEVKIYLNENIISEDGNNIKNKYMTDEQKKRALEIYKNCNDKIENKKVGENIKKQENIEVTESELQEEKDCALYAIKKIILVI